MTKELKAVKEKAVEEFFAILFMYLVDLQKYGKAIEDMENEMLQKKDPFLKNVSDASRLLDGWQNNFGGHSICTEANDGVAWHLPPCLKTRKSLRRQEKRKR